MLRQNGCYAASPAKQVRKLPYINRGAQLVKSTRVREYLRQHEVLAQEQDRVFGAGSIESRIAWEFVDEIESFTRRRYTISTDAESVAPERDEVLEAYCASRTTDAHDDPACKVYDV